MISKKIFYYVKIKLMSPLSVGNGEDELTDHDVLRNNKGYPFIPGSSLAGIFSHYLTNDQRKIFAPIKNGDYIQSPYFISDATIIANNTNEIKTSIRDGVKLTQYKTAEDSAKYDFEIIETGSEFEFRIEVTVRDNNDESQMKNIVNLLLNTSNITMKDVEQKMKNIVNLLLNGLNSGEILIGFKSKRGYGKVEIVEAKIKEFEPKQLEELVVFDKYNKDMYENYEEYKESKESRFDHIEIDLKQLGGLSIRKYSAKAGEVDFEHIKSNNTPVIPGTSWSGLIRKQAQEYSKMLNDTDICVDEWFGKEKRANQKAQASNIIIEESQIEGGKEISLTRTKIDRFSGGAQNRALFSEKAHFNGITTLRINVKKEITIDNKIIDNNMIMKLIALTIKDIDNGLIALGGQTSIGRGIFEVIDVKLNNRKCKLDDLIENGGENLG